MIYNIIPGYTTRDRLMYLRSCPHAPLIHCSKQLYEYLYQNGLPFDVELPPLPFSYATHFHLVMLELVFGARINRTWKYLLDMVW
jgi:hypothetical protein